MLDNIKIKIANRILCPASWSWESNNNGWTGYHVWFVAGGGATIKVEDIVYHLSTGDSFLFDLDKNHICTHNPENPLYVYTAYMHIEDLNSASVRRWKISNDMVLGEMLDRCISNCNQNRDLSVMYLRAIIGEFLSDDNSKKEVSPAVSVICENLKKNPQKFYHLEDMCRLTGYSKNQIIRLFRRDTGMTPIQFQLQQKIQFAVKLLSYSNKTITEIAAEIGIYDINYFSKVFKKYMGRSPRSYRNDIGSME